LKDLSVEYCSSLRKVWQLLADIANTRGIWHATLTADEGMARSALISKTCSGVQISANALHDHPPVHYQANDCCPLLTAVHCLLSVKMPTCGVLSDQQLADLCARTLLDIC
jgi:hypothetical protein